MFLAAATGAEAVFLMSLATSWIAPKIFCISQEVKPVFELLNLKFAEFGAVPREE